MLRRLIFIVGLVLAAQSLQAQFGSYKSLSLNANAYFVDMNLEDAASNSPFGIHWGVGGTYGMSVKEYLNVRFGVDFFYFQPKNVRGYYSFCDHDGIDISCAPFVTTVQLHFPIELEFYTNSNYREYRTFFIFGIMPVFSVVEEVDMFVFDQFLNQIEELEIKNNGLKAQNFYLTGSACTEFLLLGNWKFFIEPTVRFSPLMRMEDYSNPLSYFTFKTGIRSRLESKK